MRSFRATLSRDAGAELSPPRSASTTPSPEEDRRAAKELTDRSLRLKVPGLDRFSGLYVLGLLIVFFSMTLPHLFPSAETAQSIASGAAVTGIIAMALLLPLASGVFDLSVAAQVGVGVTVVSWTQSHGWNLWASIVAALLVGLAIGTVNGLVVVQLRVNSFIATLGMSSILVAAGYWVTNGQQITSGFDKTFLSAGTGKLLQIPYPVLYLAVIAALLWAVTEHTPVGRYFYATGGNSDAARLAGVRVDRMVLTSLVASGFLAAIAAIILTAQLGVGVATVGPPYLLPAFAAVFLGATQVKRRRVNVLGTLVAVFLLATGEKGLELAGAPLYVSSLFDGTALIIAVALSVRSNMPSKS